MSMQAEVVQQPIIEELERKLQSCDLIKKYIFAGNATVTLRSVETQTRYTYKLVSIARVTQKFMSKAERSTSYGQKKIAAEQGKFWVKLLIGPDNETSFIYMCMVDLRMPANRVFKTRGSFSSLPTPALKNAAPSYAAFEFFIRWIHAKEEMTPKVEVWHSGRCGRCGKKLTVPESIAAGIGPDCASKGGF